MRHDDWVLLSSDNSESELSDWELDWEPEPSTSTSHSFLSRSPAIADFLAPSDWTWDFISIPRNSSSSSTTTPIPDQDTPPTGISYDAHSSSTISTASTDEEWDDRTPEQVIDDEQECDPWLDVHAFATKREFGFWYSDKYTRIRTRHHCYKFWHERRVQTYSGRGSRRRAAKRAAKARALAISEGDRDEVLEQPSVPFTIRICRAGGSDIISTSTVPLPPPRARAPPPPPAISPPRTVVYDIISARTWNHPPQAPR